MGTERIKNRMTDLFLDGKRYEKVKEDRYSKFCYPRRIKLTRFETERYCVAAFGHFMTMHTRTVFGMELLTASFMPGEGACVPYLLIDIMMMMKKVLAFVEYYDCREEKTPQKRLERVREEFGGWRTIRKSLHGI